MLFLTSIKIVYFFFLYKQFMNMPISLLLKSILLAEVIWKVFKNRSEPNKEYRLPYFHWVLASSIWLSCKDNFFFHMHFIFHMFLCYYFNLGGIFLICWYLVVCTHQKLIHNFILFPKLLKWTASCCHSLQPRSGLVVLWL